jgi:hypothetical protein
LREAETILGKMGNALLLGVLAEGQAYLALALAATHRLPEARARYRAVRPLLVAQTAGHLLPRVDAALGGADSLKN